MVTLGTARTLNEASKRNSKLVELHAHDDVFDGISSWVDKVTDPMTARVSYQPVPDRRRHFNVSATPGRGESMTAIGLLSRALVGRSTRDPRMLEKGADRCFASMPSWGARWSQVDMYVWFWGAQAMYQLGGYRLGHALRDVGVTHQNGRRALRLHWVVGSRGPVGPRRGPRLLDIHDPSRPRDTPPLQSQGCVEGSMTSNLPSPRGPCGIEGRTLPVSVGRFASPL